jgi:hypothetical protein
MAAKQMCNEWQCGKPSIPGLIQGAGKCQYHYNVGQFGKEWADKVEADKAAEQAKFLPEHVAAALAFKERWTKARCKKRGYRDWREALQVAYHQGWDDREPDGGLLRAFRNMPNERDAFTWLATQGK